ncbi:MAG: beta-N-acetylhexosaminidase [Armatimonadota bacterium]|nr:MAG: beta-N-acetylhexosaminidase [Armatimonadota bacterium]
MSSRVDSLLGSLSLDEKIGQLLMFGWQGETHEENITVSSHARLLLEEFKVGGVVLLGRNVGTPAETARCMNELQERSKLPLFIIVDQEGGMVARFKDPFVVFPANMALGATGDPSLAYRAARATAEQLRAVGVNFNFAPCVDVNNNPLNPIIGTRSYGDNPETVARFAPEAIRGLHEGGVMTSAKHFPGHGDTAVDSHLALPVVDFPRERMDAVELPPFRAAMDAGVASIMTTHILFPALDPELPSTLSPRIITGLLREEMGWQGLVVTDDLEMKGVADKWGAAQAAVLSLKAGVDCPLICHTLETQVEAVRAIKDALAAGEITEERIDASVRRVLELKERFGLLDGVAPVDPEAALPVVSSPEKKALALEIARRAVTVVRNGRGVIPADPGDGRIVVISLHHSVERLGAAFRAIHPRTDVLAVSTDQARSPESIALPEDAGLVVVGTCPSEPWTAGLDVKAQATMVKHLLKWPKPVCVVALRDPYDLLMFPEVQTYVALYGYRDEMLQSCAEVVLGRISPSGRVPVTLPESA